MATNRSRLAGTSHSVKKVDGQALPHLGAGTAEHPGDHVRRADRQRHGLGEQVRLAVEVVVHQRRVDTGEARDGAQRAAASYPLVGELGAGGVDDQLPGVLAGGSSAPGAHAEPAGGPCRLMPVPRRGAAGRRRAPRPGRPRARPTLRRRVPTSTTTAPEGLLRQRLEQLGARLRAAARDQVLVAAGAAAVGQVDVPQPGAQGRGHLHRVRPGGGGVRQVERDVVVGLADRVPVRQVGEHLAVARAPREHVLDRERDARVVLAQRHPVDEVRA